MNLNDSNFTENSKDQSIFVIFLAVLSALEVSVNLIHKNFMVGK